MTTRADLRARVRAELNDAGATSLWASADLDRWLAEALRELGRDLGLEKAATLTSVAGQAGYALPGDVLALRRVEHPAGTIRIRRGQWHVASDEEGGESRQSAYDAWGATLTLAPAPVVTGEAIVLRYLGAYAEPSSDASVLDVPARDEDLVVWLICARAMAWIGNDEAKRQRVERERGARPDESVRDFEGRYRDAVRQRRTRVNTSRLAIRGC